MFKKIVSIGLIVFSMVTTTLFSFKGFYLHQELLMSYMGSKGFKITNQLEQGSGSGSRVTLPSGVKIILTNRHVCDIAKKGELMRIISPDGIKVDRPILVKSDKADLCAIAADSQEAPGLKLRPWDIGHQEHLFVVGHPKGRPQTLSTGMAIGFDEVTIAYGINMFNADECWGDLIDAPPLFKMFGVFNVCFKTLSARISTAPGQPGSSGSPVVDFYGYLVGVLFAGDPESAHMSILVPYEDVKEFLNSIHF